MRRPAEPAPADVAFAAAACAVLAAYNNLAGLQPWHRRWYPAVNALRRRGRPGRRGRQRADRSRPRPPPGPAAARARLGSAAAAPVVAAFGLAALTPATRPLLDDQRVAVLDRRQLAYHVLLRIPLGTVAWEEIAFRGYSRRRCAGCWPSPRRPAWPARPSACGTSARPPRRWPPTGSRPAAAPGWPRSPPSRPGPRRRARCCPPARTVRQPGRAGHAAPGRQLRGPAGQRPGPAYRWLAEVRPRLPLTPGWP